MYEQQSAPLAQTSPLGAQPAIVAHVEPVQTPLQHSLPAEHVAPTRSQPALTQTSPTQRPEQHSAAIAHVLPVAAHESAASTAGAASSPEPPGSSSTSSWQPSASSPSKTNRRRIETSVAATTPDQLATPWRRIQASSTTSDQRPLA